MVTAEMVLAVMENIYGFLRTTLGRLVAAALVVVATFFIVKITHALFKRHVKKSHKLGRMDQTQMLIFRRLFAVFLYIVGIGIAIYIIPSLRTISISLFAGAGILAVIIGFASQQAFSNVVSGIFIAIYEPFRVGDIIKFGERIGTVEDITLRHTVIKNFENKRFIVPNSIISNDVIENYNIGDERVCKWVEFGISYDSDIDKALKIMEDEALKHPNFLDVRTDEEKEEGLPPVKTKVIGFGDSSVHLRAWVWAKDPSSAYNLGWDLNRSIKKRFDKEGIEIPFPYRTIVYKNDMKKGVKRSKAKTGAKRR